MVIEKILELARIMGASRVRVSSDSVMMNCPFAPYLHSDGYDARPSFGIKAGKVSIYHCFACGMKGRLSYLPYALMYHSGHYNNAIAEFIQLYDYEPFYVEPINSTNFNAYGNNSALFSLYSSFDELQPCLGLHDQIINTSLWGLKYDRERNAVVFPVYDRCKNLIALKGRALESKKFFYYDGSINVKKAGLWYGMHIEIFPANKKKAIFLCEGERDAILLSYFNFNAWASLGAAITKQQIETIRQLQNPIILFFDNDKAGQEAKDCIISSCRVFNIIYEVTDYCYCKDPAEIIKMKKLSQSLKSIKKIS